MQQHDGTGPQVGQQAGQYAVRRAAHAVIAARAPAHAHQAQRRQHRRHERVGHAHHRAVPARRAAADRFQRLVAAFDLGTHRRRAQPPEPGLRVGVAVVAQVMPAAQDLPHQGRVRQCALADQEECRLRLVPVQQVQQRRGLRAGAIVDRQPDAVTGVGQAVQHRRVETAVGQEHRHHEQRVGGHHQRQPPAPAGQHPDQDHRHLRRHQPGQPAPRPGRDAMQCSCVGHAP